MQFRHGRQAHCCQEVGLLTNWLPIPGAPTLYVLGAGEERPYSSFSCSVEMYCRSAAFSRISRPTFAEGMVALRASCCGAGRQGGGGLLARFTWHGVAHLVLSILRCRWWRCLTSTAALSAWGGATAGEMCSASGNRITQGDMACL
jgi:hypothetical protein